MNALKTAVHIFLIVSGIAFLAASFLTQTGINDLLVADRWMFLVIDEGIEDTELAYRIAQSLASDTNPPWLTYLTCGILMALSGAIAIFYPITGHNGKQKS